MQLAREEAALLFLGRLERAVQLPQAFVGDPQIRSRAARSRRRLLQPLQARVTARALASTWRMTKSITLISRTASSEEVVPIRIQLRNRYGSVSAAVIVRMWCEARTPTV